MARDSYPVPLYSADTDIEKVGGKGAYVGMLREGTDGKKYVLVQNSGATVAAGGKFIWAFDGGTAGKVQLASAFSRCSGINADIVKAIPTSGYFWMQIEGRSNDVFCSGTTSVTNGTEVCAAAGGLCASLIVGNGAAFTLANTITHTAGTETFVVHQTGKIGWALSTATASLADILIIPGFVWTGDLSGTGLDGGYEEDAEE